MNNFNFKKFGFRSAFVFLLVLIPFLGNSQNSLPVSKNFSKALQAKTRTTIGIPGPGYWQNRISYDITAEVIPSEKKLIGSEKISFVNNSPDTLYQIVFHLFQNLYKKGSQRDSPVNPDDIGSGVKIRVLEIDNRLITNFKIIGTLLIAELKTPVFPSEAKNINVKWSFSIPSKTNMRMGAKDDSSFFLGQWYPKVAVYDDIKGWDMNIHTGGQEFYYDIGNYKYTVKVPDGYMVWGSGLLKNGKEVLQNNIYKKFLEAHQSDAIIPIISLDDFKKSKPLTKSNIWKFEADQVSDVAFGISNHFLWDASSLEISGNKIFVEAVYPPKAKDFTEVVKLAKKTLVYLSTDLPGVPFPFPAVTVFNGTNGSSGMEYPMIENDPSADNHGRTVDVTAHEITHNYFPFYVLTNETEHAWMDEAFASMLPYKYQLKNEPSLNRLTRFAKSMSKKANTDWNIAAMTNSTMLKGRISYFNNYMKPAVALYVLKDMLGEKLFRQCLITYINTWKRKHPTPTDFFNIINQTAHQNLNWFWKSWFFENGYPDLSINHIAINNNSYEITIKKLGDLPVPLNLIVTFNDHSIQRIHYSAAIWRDKSTKIVTIKTNKKIDKLKLGNDYIPDINLDNNILYIK